MRRKPKLRFRNQAIRVQELWPNLHPAGPSTGTGEDAPEPGDSGRGEETPPERLSQMVAQLRQEDKVDDSSRDNFLTALRLTTETPEILPNSSIDSKQRLY